jgi:hypothetical protein
MTATITISTLTCPACAAQTTYIMPTDACLIVAACPACGQTMRPKAGGCCVLCSYGDVPCPSIQQERAMLSGSPLQEPLA